MSRLAPYFTRAEFEITDTALPNSVPDAATWSTLRVLCAAVLVPLRERLGCPVIISSGYRTLEVNRAVGGSDDSQHLLGEAADIVPGDGDRVRLWAALVDMAQAGHLIDQAIIYEDGRRHVHVSTTLRRLCRRELLVRTPDSYELLARYRGVLT